MIKEEEEENVFDKRDFKSRKTKVSKKGKKGMGNKRNSRGRFNKSGSKSSLSTKSVDVDHGGISSENDISWYAKNPDLLQQAGNLSWGYKLGLPVNFANENFTFRYVDTKPTTRVPGFMFVGVIPGPGVTANEDTFQESDAINLAAKDQYAYIRYANSGHANYDSQDLMMYYLAWDEIQMEICDAMRAYGTANITNMQNRYMPRALVQALGWDYEAIVSNRANFASKINSAIARLGAFPVPKGMPYFDRHRWLFSNLFTDETSLKSQIFGFKKIMYRYFEHNSENEAGALIAERRPGAYGETLLTPDVWFDKILNLINRISDSEDMGIIMGDILKAWGTENCMTIDYMAQDYVCTPAYSEEIKIQFENMYIHSSLIRDGRHSVGSDKDISVYDITQDPNVDMGRIVYRPYTKISSIYAGADIRPTDDREFNAINPTAGNALLNIHKDSPSVADVVIATRGVAPVKLSVNEVNGRPETERPTSTGGFISGGAWAAFARVLTAGSEIYVDGRVYCMVESDQSNYAKEYNSCLFVTSCNTVQITEVKASGYPSTELTTINYPEGLIDKTLEYLDPFAQHVNIWKVEPRYVKKPGGLDFAEVSYNKYFDIDNYTIIHPETLRNLHDQCLLSMFNVPVTIKVKGKID